MVNWKVFEIKNLSGIASHGLYSNMSCLSSICWTLYLDEYVEFADGYKEEIKISVFEIGIFKGEFIEIDLDQTKLRNLDNKFEKEVLRKIPKEVAIRRRMESVASADQTALAITREGIERVKNGEINEFEYKMVDNSGNNHHWIYRK